MSGMAYFLDVVTCRVSCVNSVGYVDIYLHQAAVSNSLLCTCGKASLNVSILHTEPAVRMQEFVATLNKNGQRWVPILDPPIHIKPGYAPYDSGIAQDVFVKDITGNPYVGQV